MRFLYFVIKKPMGADRPGGYDDDIDMDAIFAGVLEQTEPCRPEEIVPSAAGWKIIVYLDRDPKTHKEVQRDIEKIMTFQVIGLLAFRYESAPNRRIVITPDAACAEELFPAEFVDLVGKYRVAAMAPKEARIRISMGAIQSTSAPDELAKQLAHRPPIISEVLIGKTDEESGLWNLEKREAVSSLDFEFIIIRIKNDDPKLEESLREFQRICEEEELAVEITEDSRFHDVAISKRPDISYKTGVRMDEANLTCLEQFDADVM